MTKQYRRIFATPSRVNTDSLCLKNIVQYYTVALTSPGFKVLRTRPLSYSEPALSTVTKACWGEVEVSIGTNTNGTKTDLSQ